MKFLRWLLLRLKQASPKTHRNAQNTEKKNECLLVSYFHTPIPCALAVAMVTRNSLFHNLHKYWGCSFITALLLLKLTHVCMHTLKASPHSHTCKCTYICKRYLERVIVSWLEIFPFFLSALLYSIFLSALLYTFFSSCLSLKNTSGETI
jgi:hypothetical protein